MKNKGIIVIFVLLLLGLGAFFMFSSKDKGPNDSKTANVDTTTSEKKTGETSSLKDLFMAGLPQSCTFSSDTDGYKSEGTIYTTKGKMRGDFKGMVDGKELGTHMIYDGETSYIWTDGENKGFKTTLSEEQKADLQNDSKSQGTVDLDQELNYSCKPWAANGAVFVLPTDVEFLSLDEMMGDLKTQMGAQCSVCEELDGEARTSCLETLKCN